MRRMQGESSFDLHENEHVGGTHFPMNSFATRLVFTPRQLGSGLLQFCPESLEAMLEY